MKLQTAKSILAYSKRYLDLSGLRIAYGTAPLSSINGTMEIKNAIRYFLSIKASG